MKNLTYDQMVELVECAGCCNIGPRVESSHCPVCGKLFCTGCAEMHWYEAHEYTERMKVEDDAE